MPTVKWHNAAEDVLYIGVEAMSELSQSEREELESLSLRSYCE